MYHSITFGEMNTWDDWHLVPESRPVFAPPTPKTTYVDVPGANGSLDMSEALTGYPVFQNRQGSFDFLVINESDGLSDSGVSYGEWCERYTTIMEYLHGQKLRAILEDDPLYYYEGRFSVNQWASEPERSKITIDYNVHPYKRSVKSSLESKWLWDLLDFNDTSHPLDDNKFSGISLSVSSWTSVTITKDERGTEPISPTFILSDTNVVNNGVSVPSTVKIQFGNIEHEVAAGTNVLHDIVLHGSADSVLRFKGPGKVSILFNEGRL